MKGSCQTMSSLLSKRRAASARQPLVTRVKKLEERLDETQVQVFKIAESQARTEMLIDGLAKRIDAMSAATEGRMDLINNQLSQLLTRLSQYIVLAERDESRCRDCPLRVGLPQQQVGA